MRRLSLMLSAIVLGTAVVLMAETVGSSNSAAFAGVVLETERRDVVMLPITSVQYCDQFNCVDPATLASIPDPGGDLECVEGPWLMTISVHVCGEYISGSDVAVQLAGPDLGGLPSATFLTHQGNNLWTWSECITESMVLGGFRLTTIRATMPFVTVPPGIEEVCVKYECNECE